MGFLTGNGSQHYVNRAVALPPGESGLSGPASFSHNSHFTRESNSNLFPGARPEDANWRALSKRNRLNRDLHPSTQDRMVAMSFTSYRTNPLAHRAIEMQINFVLGNGITLTSKNPEVLATILHYWHNEWNNWPFKNHRRLRDLYIYGEWLHRPIVNEETGFVYINDIQPDTISAIEIDPINHSEVDKVFFKQVVGEQYQGGTDTRAPASIIRRRLDPATATLGPWSGDVFHFGINTTSDSNRGVGELFPVLDYLDLYDSILISRAEKIETMSHVFYDLELEGMSEQEIRNYLAKETNLPPEPGTVWAHNKQAQIKAVTPDLRADDHAVDVAGLKSFIVSSLGWPGTWFDDPGTAGRAVGAEMAEPALKNILSLQATVGQFLSIEFDYAIAHAVRAGTIKRPIHGNSTIKSNLANPDTAEPLYTISFNRPSARDMQRVGPALARMGQWLEILVNKAHILDQEEARRIVVSQINQLNLSDAPISIELPVELRKLRQKREAYLQSPDGGIHRTPKNAADEKLDEDLDKDLDRAQEYLKRHLG